MLSIIIMLLSAILSSTNAALISRTDMTSKKATTTNLTTSASVTNKIPTNTVLPFKSMTSRDSDQTPFSEIIKENGKTLPTSTAKTLKLFLNTVLPKSTKPSVTEPSASSGSSPSLDKTPVINAGRRSMKYISVPKSIFSRKHKTEVNMTTQVFNENILEPNNSTFNASGTMPCNHTHNPCLNGGTCFVEDGHLKCRCSSSYEGVLCGTHSGYHDTNARPCNLNELSELPCMHGGECFVENSSPLCKCKGNYGGRYCHETVLDKIPSTGHKPQPDRPRSPKPSPERPDPWPDLKPTVEASNVTNYQGEHENSSSLNKSRGRNSSVFTDSGEFPRKKLDPLFIYKPDKFENSSNGTSIKSRHVGSLASRPVTAGVIGALILLVALAVVIIAFIYFCRRRDREGENYVNVGTDPGESPREQDEQDEVV